MLSHSRASPPGSFVGLSSRKNANPFIFMQIFAADLRGEGEVCVFFFKKPLPKYQIPITHSFVYLHDRNDEKLHIN